MEQWKFLTEEDFETFIKLLAKQLSSKSSNFSASSPQMEGSADVELLSAEEYYKRYPEKCKK